MATKSKFQIARGLEDKIKRISESATEFEPEFAQLKEVYILGFRSSNVNNFVGITHDHKLHHAGYPVLGLAYFGPFPGDQHTGALLEQVSQFNSSAEGLGSFKQDKDEHLYLVYYLDEQSNQVVKKVFDLQAGSIASEQPKLSVLDEAKVFNHSSLIKLSASIKLNICEGPSKLASSERIESTLDEVKRALTSDNKRITCHLGNSNYCFDSSRDNKSATESFYDHLDVPAEVLQAGDYLPQQSKADLAKLADRWRNRIKAERAPLAVGLELEGLSFDRSERDQLGQEYYGLELDEFLHIHVNDPISKTLQVVLFLLRQKLDLVKLALAGRAGGPIEAGELKSCTFKPACLAHLAPALYSIPSKTPPDYGGLLERRRSLHLAYLVPLDRPQFRYSQRVSNVELRNPDELSGYVCNPHGPISEKSGVKGDGRSILEGTYTYHHYLQDKISDSGWGCAYRSLQTIISWFKHQGYIYSPDVEASVPPGKAGASDQTVSLRDKLTRESRVPTHQEIQRVLVDMGDKDAKFIGSEKWIGSQEVCYVLSHLYNIESKFISVSSGGELVEKARDLSAHFAAQSTPVMIGGGVLAHTIIGVHFNDKSGDMSYLILDPHYTGADEPASIISKGGCGWKKNSFWDKSAFYNLCLPQRPSTI